MPSSQVEGEGLNWAAASAVRGVRSVTIPLVLGNAPVASGEHAYTVELLFVQPAADAAMPDKFDVAIQGRSVLQDFTIEKSRSTSRFSITEQFKDIQADRELTITFTPKQGETVICGVLVTAQVDPSSSQPVT